MLKQKKIHLHTDIFQITKFLNLAMLINRPETSDLY